jgi:phosphatidate cytidylyltransferase
LLRARALSALVLAPIAALIVWAGGWWFFTAIAVIAMLGGFEFSQLMRQGDYAPTTIFVLAIAGVSLLAAQFPSLNIIQPGLTMLLLLSISWQLFRSQDDIPTTNWALTAAGGLYVGWLSANAIRLRGLAPNEVGLAWMVLALLITWGGDSAAYFVGRAVGRHKFWPRLSPRKTWEGVFAGIIGCLLIGALVGYVAMRLTGAIGPIHGLAVGLLAGIVGPFGDLAVSMMKRQVNTKDSGQLIPGHGGVLDRTDSLLFIVATTYYYAIWIAR